jgi:hypothetical protein
MATEPPTPAEASPEHAWLPPSQLRLRSGLLLQAQGTATATPPFEARYIGAIEGKCLFLEALGSFQFNAAVRAGESLAIRGFTGQYDFRFATRVLQACDFSFREPGYVYAVIEFPPLVHARKVRSSMRIGAAIPATATPIHGLPPGPATIVDLSVEGALLLSEDELGHIGDLVNIGFSIGTDEDLAYVEALCRVCHRRIGDEGVLSGILFETLADRDRVRIRELVLDATSG